MEDRTFRILIIGFLIGMVLFPIISGTIEHFNELEVIEHE